MRSGCDMATSMRVRAGWKYAWRVLTLSRPRLVDVTAATLAVTVFAFGLGSSSVVRLHQTGSHLKWIALVVLVLPAVVLAFRGRSRKLPDLAVLVASGLFAAIA